MSATQVFALTYNTDSPFSKLVEHISKGLASISVEDWAWVGVAVHISLTILMIVRILSKQRNMGIAIAWLTLLFAIPFLGFIAYLLIGEPYLGKSYKSRNSQAQKLLRGYASRESIEFEKVHQNLPQQYKGVSLLGTNATGFGVYDQNSMQLITTAQATFDSIIQDISQAKEIILMEFYIIYPKGMVHEVFRALIDAAERGVECQILADSVGSFSFFTDDWHERLTQAGVNIHQSLPVGLFKTLFQRTDLRNHRKIVVIDDHIAYTGSFNLVDPEFFKKDKAVGEWIDLVMRIQSHENLSIVTALAAVNVTDIGAESSTNLKELGVRIDERINTYTRKLYRPKPTLNDVNDKPSGYLSRQISSFSLSDEYGGSFKPGFSKVLVRHKAKDNLKSTALENIDSNFPMVENVLAQLIPSAPRITEHVIYDTLLSVFHRANQSIDITTPYFVPDEALLAALTTAAKRGVEVTLILPKKVDSFLVQHASQASYAILMEAGVKIGLFKGGLLHAKTVVIDKTYCLFGTVNMDMRSFYLNMEISMALYTPAIVEQVRNCQQAYLTQCDILKLNEWNQRPKYKKLFDSGVRLFSPLL